MSQVVTARKIARHYNAGLEDAIASTQAHNDQVAHDLLESGATGKDINRALLPIPERCPEDLNGRFVRKFLRAFNWRKVSRNTGGNYLAARMHILYFQVYTFVFVGGGSARYS